jgi:cytochrome c oxidase subunit II
MPMKFRHLTRLIAGLGFASFSALIAAAEKAVPWQLNMTTGATKVAAEVHDLHMLMFYICCAIGVVVFGAMFWSMFRHRKSLGVKPAQFSHSTTAEVIWTIVPIAILVVMAIPATRTLIKMSDASGTEMTVKITGYQWKWRYDYIEEKVGFVSSLDPKSNAIRRPGSGQDPNTHDNYLLDVDRPLKLPVGTKIRFLITADDVIHAWWVPALGWKRDAIPGFINEAWTLIDKPGIYRGQCAELCGKDHGFMPIVVEAVSKEEFTNWVAEQRGTETDLRLAAQPSVPAVAQTAP